MTAPLPFGPTVPAPQQLTLRPYQREAVDAVHAAAERGLQRPLVAMATGTGKSLVAGYVVAERGERAVVLAHRDELIRQLGQSMLLANPKAHVGYVKAGENEIDAEIVVASLQTLARENRIQELIAAQSRFGKFSTVVSDESHHVLTGVNENSFGGVLRGIGAFTAGGPLTSGYTATPERGDGKAIGGGLWQEIVYRMSILDGIRQGYLCELRGIEVQLAADFNQLHIRGGEFRDGESAEMLMQADAPKHAARAYLEHAAGRRALVFTPTIAVAEAMEDAFRAEGVPCEHVSGEMPLEERRAIQHRLRTGETLVCPNAMLWTEGFDLPAISCIIMARPTRSRPFAIQMIGRGTRIYPGKSDCVVLDLVGTTVRKDLVTLAELFDLDREEARRGVAKATEEKRRRSEEAVAIAAPDGRLRVREVNLYDRSNFHWVTAREDRFALSLGEEGNLLVEPESFDSDQWALYQQTREIVAGSQYPQNVRRKLYMGLPLETIQGIAEDMVRRSGAARLNDKSAAWRQQPPSEKQKAILVRRGKWRENMTKGDASDAITALFAGR